MFALRQVIRTVPILATRGIKTSLPRTGGAWVYREPPVAASRFTVVKAEILGAIMWWWIIYHLLTEPEHITGEFPYPDASKWTNEELGIPADDED